MTIDKDLMAKIPSETIPLLIKDIDDLTDENESLKQTIAALWGDLHNCWQDLDNTRLEAEDENHSEA